MQLLPFILVLGAIPAALALPSFPHEARDIKVFPRQSCPVNSGGGCGSYTVSGLGARKQQILNSGGRTWELAIAMMETEKMEANYAYGDNKQNDSANFGIFKQNWGMLRECCPQFKGQTTAQWNNGAALNSQLSKDITCRIQCQNYYGVDKWFGGHRNGASGLANSNTADINLYKTSATWTQTQIANGHTTDDIRFWVDVVVSTDEKYYVYLSYWAPADRNTLADLGKGAGKKLPEEPVIMPLPKNSLREIQTALFRFGSTGLEE